AAETIAAVRRHTPAPPARQGFAPPPEIPGPGPAPATPATANSDLPECPGGYSVHRWSSIQEGAPRDGEARASLEGRETAYRTTPGLSRQRSTIPRRPIWLSRWRTRDFEAGLLPAPADWLQWCPSPDRRSPWDRTAICPTAFRHRDHRMPGPL